VKQNVPLVSGVVYRLSAAARSVATNASEIIFGGRVALFLPPQPEQQIVWMSEYNNWWPKSLVFTNQVSCTAARLHGGRVCASRIREGSDDRGVYGCEAGEGYKWQVTSFRLQVSGYK